MSFALLRPGVLRFCAASFAQPRCALQLKSRGVDYYWLDYPYEKLHELPSIYDRPQYRLNDNSRSLCVEGNIAIGKGTFSRNLADVLYLKYVPDVSDTDFFIDKNYEPHLDYRDYNAVLPKKLQFYTTEKLFTDKDPIHEGRPLYIQQNFYMYRSSNWWKSCAHLFHTGQGFVMKRSPFSTFVFAKAMAECGLMSEDAKDWFLYYDKHVRSIFLYPHLVIYLRSPVELSRAGLAKRGLPWESGVTDKFLQVVKEVYEREYLPQMARYSEVTTIDVEDYNFEDTNDITYIAEQLCKIDLDQKHLSSDIDTKLIHWRQSMCNTQTMQHARRMYGNSEPCIRRLLGIQVPDDMSEGGLTLPEAESVRKLLLRDPRQHDWSLYNTWDAKSAMDVLFDRMRHDPTRVSFWYDEDWLKKMVIFRSFGPSSRDMSPVFRKD